MTWAKMKGRIGRHALELDEIASGASEPRGEASATSPWTTTSSCLHGLGGDLLLVALALDDFREQPFLAALLLPHFVELLLDGGEFGFDGVDGIPFGSEVAGDENATPGRGRT